MPLWSLITPLAAAALLALSFVLPQGIALGAASAVALVGAVIAAVHHAEVIAHRVGEPFGTLVLALAVTVIEVALIVSMMLAGGPDKATLPRDTIFSTLMIICNGVVGMCLVVGSLRHHEQVFRVEGANTGLDGDADPRIADLYHQLARTDLHHTATGFRGHDVAGAVVGVRFRADQAPP
jgi:Ca2+:H+ antiporter